MFYPLSHEIGYLVEKDSAEQTLDGTYDIPAGTDRYTSELIYELRLSLIHI